MSSAGEQEAVVAQVVLKPASGREITGDSIITADTLPSYLPSPEDASIVARELAGAGFDVGPLMGIGMTISGPRALFEDCFGTEVTESAEGGWVATGAATRELPTDSLPEAVATRVHAVTFEPPAEAVT